MKIIFSKEKHTHENKTLRNIILLHSIQKNIENCNCLLFHVWSVSRFITMLTWTCRISSINVIMSIQHCNTLNILNKSTKSKFQITLLESRAEARWSYKHETKWSFQYTWQLDSCITSNQYNEGSWMCHQDISFRSTQNTSFISF